MSHWDCLGVSYIIYPHLLTINRVSFPWLIEVAGGNSRDWEKLQKKLGEESVIGGTTSDLGEGPQKNHAWCFSA